MGTVVLHRCKGIIRVCLSESVRAVHDLRNSLIELAMQLMSKSACNILACTGRKLQLDGYTSVIRLREELSLGTRSEKAYCSDENTQ